MPRNGSLPGREWRAPWHLLVALLLVLSASVVGAHGGDAHEHTTEHEEHQEAEGIRVPNNGAVIRILSPAASTHFVLGDDIHVRVEVENFVLGRDGNHWHVSIDGVPWAMIEDASTETLLQGLEPGVHVMEVLLADGAHRDLEQGDTVTLVVEARMVTRSE